MPRMGEIRVKTNISEIREAIDWLRRAEKIFPTRTTILTSGGKSDRRSSDLIKELSKQLSKASKRKRLNHRFVINLRRTNCKVVASYIETKYLTSVYVAPSPNLFGTSASLDAPRLLDTIRLALDRKVGRPRLSNEQIQSRISGRYHCTERHQKRLKARLKVSLKNLT